MIIHFYNGVNSLSWAIPVSLLVLLFFSFSHTHTHTHTIHTLSKAKQCKLTNDLCSGSCSVGSESVEQSVYANSEYCIIFSLACCSLRSNYASCLFDLFSYFSLVPERIVNRHKTKENRRNQDRKLALAAKWTTFSSANVR